jgi:hypothetical protein
LTAGTPLDAVVDRLSHFFVARRRKHDRKGRRVDSKRAKKAKREKKTKANRGTSGKRKRKERNKARRRRAEQKKQQERGHAAVDYGDLFGEDLDAEMRDAAQEERVDAAIAGVLTAAPNAVSAERLVDGVASALDVAGGDSVRSTVKRRFLSMAASGALPIRQAAAGAGAEGSRLKRARLEE